NKSNIAGFTLMEIIIYIVIFTIIGGFSTAILLNIVQVQQRESASSELAGQMNFILQTIQRLVRSASNIEIEAGANTSILKLRMADSAKDPTCIFLTDGIIKISEGPDESFVNCSANAVDLTDDKIIVENLNFKKFTSYPGHDSVSVDIQLTYNNEKLDSVIERTLQTSISRISAATFDANILPGDSTYDIGQVGSPWQKIFMSNGSAIRPSYTFASSTMLGIYSPSYNVLGFTVDGVERMRINEKGNIGIKTTNPGYTLTVNGAAWVASGAWSGSDIRWKKDIVSLSLSDSLNKIKLLNPISFIWKNEEYSDMHFNNGIQFGFIAQEMEKIIPEIVTINNDGYKGISYERLVPILTAAIQEQQKQIDELKTEINILKTK
ncbi:tail fiber domain-containing protein, partial [Candidatus Wolfebacteria bacterium]|nr:tail fiber domain-containing protein [Candidatus Wolfebacteria bacterium]